MGFVAFGYLAQKPIKYIGRRGKVNKYAYLVSDEWGNEKIQVQSLLVVGQGQAPGDVYPELAASMVLVPDGLEVAPGWRWNGKTFVEPKPDKPGYIWDTTTGGWLYKAELDSPGPEYRWDGSKWVKWRFSKLAFYSLFTLSERIALKTAISGGNAIAAVIDDSLKLAEFISIDDLDTINVIQTLTSEMGGNVLTPERAAEILAGVKYEPKD